MENSVFSDLDCQRDRKSVADLYFMEHRAKLLDIAAFLDRLDRAPDDSNQPDIRITTLTRACLLLTDEQPHRVRRLLELFSDMTTTMEQSAGNAKGAIGVASR